MICRCFQNNNNVKLSFLQQRRFLSSVARTDKTLVNEFSSPSLRTQVNLARTLYRQILKWTVRTGSQVPFDPLPPLTLAPPRVDPTTLRLLSLEIQNMNLWDERMENDSLGLDISPSMMADIKMEIKRIAKAMPANTMVKEHQITVPFYNADDIKKATQMIYKLNSIVPQSRLDLDQIKDRVNLGFQVYKSLNQLSELLDGRKLSREKHMDRDGVQFHVGQVVQHKTKRWRAIVGGWDKIVPKVQNEQNTSLTQKSYQFGANIGNDEMIDNMEMRPKSDNSPEVEYILHLDEGDATFSRTRVLGSTKVKQQDLEVVEDSDLKRVRNSLIKYQFTGFDCRNMEFIPGKVLQFEYPVETSCGIQQQEDNNDLWKETKYDLDKHENAKIVMDGVKAIALQLHRIILDTTSCAKARNIPILYELERKIQEIEYGQDHEASDAAISSHKLAIQYLSRLINLISEINNVLWQRSRAKENKDRVHFPLGSVVRHKKYGFRGVVISWDPYPQTDVSNWDGLQDLNGDVHSMPFYHVIPDLSDTVKAFGQERPFRYVCQDNLEWCPESDLDIEVTLDEGWSASEGRNEFIAPDILKFSHFEKITEEEIIDACFNDLQIYINQSLIRMRKNGPDYRSSNRQRQYSSDTYLCIQNLFDLLKHSECFEDALLVEESIKEVWKAHSEVSIKWQLYDGLAHLLRGDRRTALSVYDSIIELDPGCTEAWNKKATCHYMLGDMARSEEAAERALQAEGRNVQALAGLGLVYYETKQYDKATQCFRKCLVGNPWSSVSSRLNFCLDALASGKARH